MSPIYKSIFYGWSVSPRVYFQELVWAHVYQIHFKWKNWYVFISYFLHQYRFTVNSTNHDLVFDDHMCLQYIKLVSKVDKFPQGNISRHWCEHMYIISISNEISGVCSFTVICYTSIHMNPIHQLSMLLLGPIRVSNT